MVGWYESIDDDTWMTRAEAAEYFKCSVWTIKSIANEMIELNLDGIWVEKGRIFRINKKAMSEYLYQRNKIKADKRFGRK